MIHQTLFQWTRRTTIAAALFAGVAQVSNAGFLVTFDHGQPGTNLLSNDNGLVRFGQTVTLATNQSHYVLDVTSPMGSAKNLFTAESGGGQAEVSATDDPGFPAQGHPNKVLYGMDTVTFRAHQNGNDLVSPLVPLGGFEAIEFDLDIGNDAFDSHTQLGWVSFEAKDWKGNTLSEGAFTVDYQQVDRNGENFFRVIATDGDVLGSVTIKTFIAPIDDMFNRTAADTIFDIKQIRIDGERPVVPEPGSVTLVAVGALVLLGVSRRRKTR